MIQRLNSGVSKMQNTTRRNITQIVSNPLTNTTHHHGRKQTHRIANPASQTIRRVRYDSPSDRHSNSSKSCNAWPNMYTASTIVPEAYKGNVGNCVIALDMATRMGVNPLMVMQNLYIVKGNPSWSSKFLIATINMSGKYTALRYRKRIIGKIGKIKYNETVYDPTTRRNTIVVKEFDGSKIDDIECVAYATGNLHGRNP